MGKKNTYTVSCHTFSENGTTAPVESLTKAELQKLKRQMSDRLGRSLSEYCRTHPGTFRTIPGKTIEKEKEKPD